MIGFSQAKRDIFARILVKETYLRTIDDTFIMIKVIKLQCQSKTE